MRVAEIKSEESSGFEALPVPEQLTNWKILRVEIEGVTPLLMHNPSMMRTGTSDKLSTKNIPTPEEEARAGRYARDGFLYLKADMLRQSMIAGAATLKINKRSANTVLAAAVMEIPDSMIFVLHRRGKAIADTDYSIDIRRCVVQRNGVQRARPLIELPWSITARFLVDTAVIGVKAEPVIAAVVRAGQLVGIGDYRPARKGSFGRFQVSSAGFEAGD